MREISVIHILIRRMEGDQVCFLLQQNPKWRGPNGKPYLALPSKRTQEDPLLAFERGTSLEEFVATVMQEDLGLADQQYALEQEIEPVVVRMPSPSTGRETAYTVYPVDVWVDPDARPGLPGQWLSRAQGENDPEVSPTARSVFRMLAEREQRLQQAYAADPQAARRADAPRLLLDRAPNSPSMDALAKKWFRENRGGVRVLAGEQIRRILDVGDRAFNLRVADPYLRYQMQGQGFTWSFFTEKDLQDVHVHGAPTVEIYGVLQGRLELWWKPYYDRGTSAWNRRVIEEGGWAEVDALHCHLVRWVDEEGNNGKGMGVVFKAGGPLAGVGRLGVQGKTTCGDCPCMKPPEVLRILEEQAARRR